MVIVWHVGSVHGSHAADMQKMLYQAGLGWSPAGGREDDHMAVSRWSEAPNSGQQTVIEIAEC